LRLDKYLKVSRIIKRRTLAKEVCDNGKVQVNGRGAKPGTEIKPGDVVELDFGHKKLKVEVIATPETVKVQEAKEIYKVLEDITK